MATLIKFSQHTKSIPSGNKTAGIVNLLLRELAVQVCVGIGVDVREIVC